MLDAVNLDWLQRCYHGSDCIRPDICLGPASALLEVNHPSAIDNSWISCCIDNKSRRIGEYDHGLRVSEEDSRLFQGGLSRLDQFGILSATLNQVRFGT